MLTVLTNGLWILGLSLLLAGFSYHYYEATFHGHSLMKQLKESSFPGIAWIAATLVAAGLAATSKSAWETVLWLLFAVYCMVSAYLFRRNRAG